MHNKDVDKLKGLGIALTVIGHAGGMFSPFIYLFHMPLFYFLTGYTFKNSNSDNIISFIKKRIKGLYILFLKYSILFILLHNFFVTVNIYGPELRYDSNTFIINFIKNILFISTEQLNGAFWFLTSIFITNIIYVLIIKLFSKKNNGNIIINSVVICLFILNITLFTKEIKFNSSILNYYFLMLRISLSGMVFFRLGHIVKENNILEKVKVNLIYFILATVYLFINTNYGAISMGSNKYGSSPTFFIFNAMIGIYVSYCIIKFISNEYFEKLLIFMGKNTIPILALHMISFKLINYLQIKVYDYPIQYLSRFPYINGSNGWWILYSLVGIIIPLLIILPKYILINKINRTKNSKKSLYM